MSNNIYLHPLDYVTGVKHYLTTTRINVEYRLSPQTFYVEELVDWDELGFDDSRGEYVVLEIRKAMIDTFQALSIISRKLNIPYGNILYLGLKDKHASAKQFFFIKKHLFNPSIINEISNDRISVKFKGFVSKKPRRRYLLGNKFVVRLGNVDEDTIGKINEVIKAISERGLPNYYGYQRFGLHRPNTHLIGLHVLTNRLNDLVRYVLREPYYWEDREVLFNRIKGCFDRLTYEKIIYSARSLSKALSKIKALTHGIYVEAYIAYLFNQLLNRVIEFKGWIYLDNSFPTAGCRDSIDLYRDLLEIDAVDPNSIPSSMCWSRKGLFKPNIAIEETSGFLDLSFALSKGTYATIVLRELFKDKFMLH